MAASNTEKLCRACKSEIDSRASKCPRCHALQGMWFYGAVYGFTGICVVAAIGLIIMVTHAGYLLYETMSRGEGPDLASDVEVVQSKHYIADTSNGKQVAIVGKFRNTGDRVIAWFDVEVRIFDRDGQLVDCLHESFLEDIRPGEEVSFKINDWEDVHLPEENYATHEVIIRKARAE